MSILVEVGLRPGVTDAAGVATARKIRAHLGIPVAGVRVRQLYRVEGGLSRPEAEQACRELLADPIIQEYSIDSPLDAEPFDASVVVAFRPGVTDNVGRTAAACARRGFGLRRRTRRSARRRDPRPDRHALPAGGREHAAGRPHRAGALGQRPDRAVRAAGLRRLAFAGRAGSAGRGAGCPPPRRRRDRPGGRGSRARPA